jgi:hypothetical protein
LIAAAIESAIQSDYHPNHNLPVPLLDARGHINIILRAAANGRN